MIYYYVYTMFWEKSHEKVRNSDILIRNSHFFHKTLRTWEMQLIGLNLLKILLKCRNTNAMPNWVKENSLLFQNIWISMQ